MTCLAFSVAILEFGSAETERGGLYDAASKVPGHQLNVGTLPVLVTITDQRGVPISGAHAALKRVQPGGYTKQDISAPSSPQSDARGQLVISYPTIPNLGSSAIGEVQLRGAITIVAEGFSIAELELSEQFPKPVGYLAVSSAPWLKVTLTRAEPGGAGQPATRSGSNSPG